MQKREKIFGAIAIGAALFFVVDQYIISPASKTAKEKTKKETASKAGQTTNKDANESRRSAGSQPVESGITYEPRLLRAGPSQITFTEWRRDPFEGALSLVLAAETTPGDSGATTLVLRGVAWKNGQGMVLIGDKVLRQNEQVDDLQVLEIFPDRALVRKNGKLLTLLLHHESIDDRQP